MENIFIILQNLDSNGIIGIMLIFIAAFMIVSASTWLIAKLRKSKNSNIHKNKIVINQASKQELIK